MRFQPSPCHTGYILADPGHDLTQLGGSVSSAALHICLAELPECFHSFL